MCLYCVFCEDIIRAMCIIPKIIIIFAAREMKPNFAVVTLKGHKEPSEKQCWQNITMVNVYIRTDKAVLINLRYIL